MTEQEIKNLAKAVFDEGTKTLSAKMDKHAASADEKLSQMDGKLKQLEEKSARLEDLETKVSKLEAAPAVGIQLVKADFGHFMGADINKAAALLTDKGLFKGDSEESRQKAALAAKWAVAAVKSMAYKNPALYADFCKANNLEGTDANGGYLVPEVLEAELIKAARENSFALQECTVFPQNASKVTFPAEDGLVAAGFVSEGAAATPSNPTFKQVALELKKAVCLTEGVSGELLEDSVVSFVGILLDQMNYAVSQLLDKTVLNGISGDSNNFMGILNPSTGIEAISLAQGKAFADISYDDLSDMITLIPGMDRAVAKFCMSRYGLGLVRRIKSTDGVPVFASAVSGEPATLLGQRYFTSENAPGVADKATAEKIVLALGNWKKYYIGMKPGSMALESDPYSSFDKDLIRYRLKMRVSGNPVRKSAFAVLKTGQASA